MNKRLVQYMPNDTKKAEAEAELAQHIEDGWQVVSINPFHQWHGETLARTVNLKKEVVIVQEVTPNNPNPVKAQLITYTNGSKALVLEHVPDAHGRDFSTYYVLNCFDVKSRASMFTRLSSNSRYIAQIDTIAPSDTVASFLHAYAGLKHEQRRMKLYQSHVIVSAIDTYLHDGSSQPEYVDYFVEADDKYETASEMAKRYHTDLYQLVGDVQAELSQQVLQLVA